MVHNGTKFYDILRFSHGDSPERAHDSGQQKGGHYFCSTCAVHCDWTYELDHVLNCELRTLQKKQQLFLEVLWQDRTRL